jgi:ADP-ribosylglycohydrolase/fructose-1,6-bisphosphatase/inositol monophosphatase family enzyme
MSYAEPLQVAIEAARVAGAHLRAELHRPGGPRGAHDHAEADEEAEAMIRDRLTAATPYAYLGEELGSRPGADPSHVWLVDPNDGTAPFLRGYRGAAVSIGLVRDGVPVLGVVYAYAFPDDEGDLLAWAEGAGPLTRNGAKVTSTLAASTLQGGVVLVSHVADYRAPENAAVTAPARYLAMPSIAYRLALAAAGEGVAAVSLSHPKAWDFAAGHALVRAAGGDLCDQDGRPIAYAPGGESRAARCFGGYDAVIRALAGRSVDAIFAPSPPREMPLTRPRVGRLERDTAALRRAQGCWLGQLSGDALGSRVEFESAAEIAARHPEGVRDLVDGGTWGTMAGQPTDDSEMALSLARSIVTRGGYDPAAALDAYCHWFGTRPFDIGGTTVAALGPASAAPPGERLARVAEVASRDSQANGALMRVSPIGILGARRPAEAAGWARADAGLTHPHPACREASAAFVAALAAAIRGEGAEGAYQAACAEAARGGDPSVIAWLAAAQGGPPESYAKNQGWVRVALGNAFFQLLHAPSLEEGVIATVMAGGDTDTNGAIAGALLGAVHGREAVPARWRRHVLTCRPLRLSGARHPRPQELWPVDALALAEALLAIGSG